MDPQNLAWTAVAELPRIAANVNESRTVREFRVKPRIEHDGWNLQSHSKMRKDQLTLDVINFFNEKISFSSYQLTA